MTKKGEGLVLAGPPTAVAATASRSLVSTSFRDSFYASHGGATSNNSSSSNHSSHSVLCKQCASRPALVLYTSMRALSEAERRANSMRAICRMCCSASASAFSSSPPAPASALSPLPLVGSSNREGGGMACVSVDCPAYAARLKANQALRAASTTALSLQQLDW